MKDTDAIDQERQRRGAELAADLRDAISFPPLPPSPAEVSDLIIECLRAELAEARADAERYRWLRDVALRYNATRHAVEVYEFIAPIAYGENIDAAIDAAIRQQ